MCFVPYIGYIKIKTRIMKLKRITKLTGKSLITLSFSLLMGASMLASSHREAPLISNDPLADNTDLYAFRSPDNPNTITIIANYIPFQLPEGGPNWASFGENVRYEIKIDNDKDKAGAEIIYRFTFNKTNEDGSTFFNVRLAKENLKTTWTLERSTDGGNSFATLKTGGVVPPPNIGARSIEGGAGLNTDYSTIMTNAISTVSTGEKVFCGPVDDPFFVDLAGVFDLGNFRPKGNTTNAPKDGVARFNVHSIVMQIPISTLQKDGKDVSQAANILDGDYVIGVWASASRQQIKTLNAPGTAPSFSGNWIQVSRLGMPLTNEAIIPIVDKDKWNATSPADDLQFAKYFSNPELALYMDDSQFGGSVPSLNELRIQENSLGAYDFRNGKKGLYDLKGSDAVKGTALDDAVFGTILLPDATSPRAVDILPIFYTGVPNLAPYHLATGKSGNPLANGKPFINNFLPTLGDMLRLNMAVPATDRNSADFSSLGLIQAAVLGLTDSRYNTDATIQAIPNMDGFPNGRRLEDDVTTIEMQAVSGVVLAAIGLWYDDYNGTGSPVTFKLGKVLGFNAGPTENDTTFKASFPYVQTPWRGTDYTQTDRF